MLRKMAMARIKKQKDLVKVCGCAVLGILYIGFASFVYLCEPLYIFVHLCASLYICMCVLSLRCLELYH